MRITIVEREPTDVACVIAVGGVAGAHEAFATLKAALGTLRGHRFFGALSVDGTYRACAAVDSGASRVDPPLLRWTIPGGRYARTRLDAWQTRIPEIGRTFDLMAERYPADPGRPAVEYYRSDEELLLLLPIA